MTDARPAPDQDQTQKPETETPPASPVRSNDAGKRDEGPATGGEGAAGAGGPDGFGTGT